MTDRQRQLHKEILESEEGTSHELYNLLLSEYGQDENQQLILSPEDTEIAVISDKMKHHPTPGYVGSKTRLIEGKCHRCGCNRLRHSRLEPAGEIWVSCTACNTNNHDHNEEHLEW
jgi:hypothetical protein